MTPSTNIAASGSDERLEELRDHLTRALDLMDDLRPSSIAAARLQQIVDELDTNFGPMDAAQG